MINVKPLLTASLVWFLGMGLAADARAQAGSGGEGLPTCVVAAKWSSAPIPGQDLWSAGGPGGVYVAAKTNAGNLALLSISALDTLVIETSQLFNPAGTLISKKEYLRVPGGSTFDLDTGTAASDTTADLKWNTGPGGKSLQPLNNAMVYACRPSDRQATPRQVQTRDPGRAGVLAVIGNRSRGTTAADGRECRASAFRAHDRQRRD